MDNLNEELALKAAFLIKKIDLVESHPKYRQLFNFLGIAYDGPDWVTELEDLRKFIKDLEYLKEKKKI